MWPFTKRNKSETPFRSLNKQDRELMERLVIENGALAARQDALWARMRRLEGSIHGLRGGGRPPRGRDTSDETFEEFRARVLKAHPGQRGDDNGQQTGDE